MGNRGSKPELVGDEKYNDENQEKRMIEAKPPLITPYTKVDAAERVLESLQNWEGITKEAILNEVEFSPQEQLSKLRNGVYLNQKRQKYWVDKMGKNCFMVYARDLEIFWSNDENYWKWTQINTTDSDEAIEVAELLRVCWLSVSGGFDTKKLSMGTLYEVSFVVKLSQNSLFWETNPAILELSLPGGRRHMSKVDMSKIQQRDQWVKIPLGQFQTFLGNQGEMRFNLREHKSGQWKRGLVVKGVSIQPKM